MIRIGIVKEYKIPNDYRTPFTPSQAKKIMSNKMMDVFCQKSDIRCYKDEEYLSKKIKVVDDLNESDIIFGIKEVPIPELIANKTYFIFSHTIKKQSYNREFLKTIIKKKIRLIDYECLKSNNKRIVAFGNYAGIAGTYNTLMAYGIKFKKFNWKRLSFFKDTKELYKFSNLNPFNDPIQILIIGNGRVASGAVELLESFNIKRVSIKDYLEKKFSWPVYSQLKVTDYIKSHDNTKFNEIEYFQKPDSFKSNYKKFSDKTDILINAAYWDPKSPKLFKEEEINKKFSVKVIGDISCDIDGAIPCTKIASTIEKPFFDYCVETKKIVDPFSNEKNITVMSIDNLPSELPRDSSKYFGNILLKKIIPLLNNDNENILEEATVTRDGDLCKKYKYLRDFIN